MGHGAPDVGADPIGDITIWQPEYLVVWGGDGGGSPAVIGHGGVGDDGFYTVEGDILLDVAGSTVLSVGCCSPYWIGHLGDIGDSEVILLTELLYTEQGEPTGTYAAVLSDPDLINVISENLMHGAFTLGIRGGGDLLLDAPIGSESPHTLTLATEGDFVNGVGSDAFPGVQRWLIYSHDPDNIVKNMLTGPEQFNSPYFPPPPVAAGFQGSGFLYVVAGQRPIPQNDTYDETERPRRIVESFLAPDPMEVGFMIHYVREAAEVLGGLMGRLSSYDLFESEETE
jgi:hypothetical protein